MYTHEPADYQCVFCRVAMSLDNPYPYTTPSDVVFRDDKLTAFVASHWWPHNAGHIIIIPNQHIENIYTMPYDVGAAVFDTAKQIAIAFKEVYACDGTSTRQHNEPAGYQEIFHYHFHVFPRYDKDYLYDLTHQRRLTRPEERLPYAEKLRGYFAKLEK